MTRDEAFAIAERFIADHEMVVGPLLDVLYDDGVSRYDEPVPPKWSVHYADTTPPDDPRREIWGDTPTIVIVDESTAQARLFCYL